MRLPSVLLTNPCGLTGEIVASSLRGHGVVVNVMERPNAKKREAYYIDSLKDAVDCFHPDIVIPVFFPEILARHKKEFPDLVIPLDSEEKILGLDNKFSACELAESLGIPQPCRYDSAEDVEKYPCVFKRASGQGGDSVYFPGKRSSLERILKDAGDRSRYLITEYIEGENVCVDALRWDNFFYASAYRVLEPSGKGVSTLRESIDAPEAVGYVRRLLDSVDYHGVCGVDFRMDFSGNLYFLECNPRFSGGVESAIASGFDIPWLYYCLAAGIQVSPGSVSFLPGIKTGAASFQSAPVKNNF